MARPARHGPTTVFRFRFRQADAERLQRIKDATSSKTDADAIRHALLVADAKLTAPTPVPATKESGRAQHSTTGSTTSVRASSAQPAPTPHGRSCQTCKTAWAQHPIGACRE
jgi:hypothetical protein